MLCLAGMAAAMLVLYFIFPAWRAVCDGARDGVLFALAPRDARWAADGLDDGVFDNSADEVSADEAELVIKYPDRTLTARRAGVIDLIRLKLYRSSCETGWLNTHKGSQFEVYSFRTANTAWFYYQHIPDTGYVFVRKEALS